MEDNTQKIKNVSLDIKNIESEIKSITSDLQKKLKDKQTELLSLKAIEKESIKNNLKNTDIHIFERYELWLKTSNKKILKCCIDGGAFRDKFKNDWEDRYYQYSVINIIDDYISSFYYNYYGNFYKSDFSTYYSKHKQDFLELYNKLNKEKQKELTDILEDVIEKNVQSFMFDW